jgi:septal ring factor EnvC (AmiA/AmiB activator)
MKELQQELTQQKTDLEQERAGLETRQAKLQKTVNQRQALLKQTRSSAQKASKKVQALANQAKDLRELLTGIQKTEAIPKIVAGWKDKVSTWFSGSATMPVAGQVKTAYGQVIDGGDKSQGLTISAMGGSIVVSPGSGTVRFAGPFRQYKLLVIIQHANGEHSLLGGLQEIYTRVGDTVVSGEPIGKLTGKLSGDRAALSSLYYERRRHGKPIDPRQARG